MIDNRDRNLIQFADNADVDAFGRLRVSQINQLFDAKHLNNKLSILFNEEVNGTATSIFDNANSCINMNVSSNNDYSIRQSYMRFNYQTGKSHLIKMTCSNLKEETDVIKRVGYFSSDTTGSYSTGLDGLFFESDNNGISINIYRNGTLIEKTYQQDWNCDTINGSTQIRGKGTNPSKLNFDFTKSMILGIDFQWLGVGRVRWFLNIDGDTIIVHESLHAGLLEDVYMKSPNQPVRYEIRSSGGTGSFKQICTSVETEGEVNENGFNIGVKSGPLTAASSANDYVALAFKLNNNNSVVKFSGLSAVGTTNDDYIVSYWLRPTLSGGALTYNTITNTGIDYAIGSGQTVTGGTLLGTQIFKSQTAVQFNLDQALRMGRSINGTYDEIIVSVQPLSNGLSYQLNVNLKELI